MSRTTTVRILVVALLLLATGGGLYSYGAYETATASPDKSGISVQPVTPDTRPATNVSDLSRDQRALFLLAVAPGSYGAFETTDEHLQSVAEEMPTTVRYDGTVYEIRTTHTDSFGGTPSLYLGIVLAALGLLTLVGAGIGTGVRRLRTNVD